MSRRPPRSLPAAAAVIGMFVTAALAGCSPPAGPPPTASTATTARADDAAHDESAGLLVATTALPDGGSGAVMISENGGAWETVLESGPLHDIAAGPDGLVAVGSGGAIWASSDGRSWTAVAAVADALYGVAYADGVWIVVGEDADDSGDTSKGVIHRSDDGVSWTRVTTTSPYDDTALEGTGLRYQGLISVATGAGMWVVTGQDCAEPSADRRAEGEHASTCIPVQFHSVDGKEWTRHALGTELRDTHVAYDGTAWAFVGTATASPEGGTACEGDPYGVAGTSDDALTWRFGATRPDCLPLAALAHDASGWWALDPWTDAADVRVHRSDDLITWTETAAPLRGATSILRMAEPSG